MRRQIATCTWLGLIAFASPAFSQQSSVNTESSTYMPGPSSAHAGATDAHSARGSAVASDRSFTHNRGGGPGTTVSQRGLASDATVSTGASRGRLSGAMVSDNQTRRPGAQSYAGASFATGRAQHGTPESPGVSMMGDSFAGRTGSATVGRVPVRAQSSNERESAAPFARGGGPATLSVRQPQPVPGQIEWRATPEQINGTTRPATVPVLTPADLAMLPQPGERNATARGLLSLDRTLRGTELLDTASAVSSSPLQLNLQLNYPPLSRAIGGGPASR